VDNRDLEILTRADIAVGNPATKTAMLERVAKWYARSVRPLRRN
jgi:hypothetical protein